MRGIYLSKEGKKEIESKIAELEKSKMILQRAVSTDPNFGEMQRTAYTKYCTEVDTYKEILSSATINIPKKEPKQQTLEEYIKEVTKNFKDEMSIKFTSGGIKLGAKWQAERMYSEKEVIEWLRVNHGI
jgi:hypothetical protein